MKKEKPDKKDLILDSAQGLMKVMQHSSITINQIAQKAGMGKGSIYYYFKSKDEIIDEVVLRSYKKALQEYFRNMNNKDNISALDKIKCLFQTVISKQFNNHKENMLITLHTQENPLLNNKMKLAAIEEISPVLTDLFYQGIAEGTINTDSPEESAEMIVAVISFLFDSSIFPENDQKSYRKLKLFANVLETCLQTQKGSFDFLFEIKE